MTSYYYTKNVDVTEYEEEAIDKFFNLPVNYNNEKMVFLGFLFFCKMPIPTPKNYFKNEGGNGKGVGYKYEINDIKVKQKKGNINLTYKVGLQCSYYADRNPQLYIKKSDSDSILKCYVSFDMFHKKKQIYEEKQKKLDSRHDNMMTTNNTTRS